MPTGYEKGVEVPVSEIHLSQGSLRRVVSPLGHDPQVPIELPASNTDLDKVSGISQLVSPLSPALPPYSPSDVGSNESQRSNASQSSPFFLSLITADRTTRVYLDFRLVLTETQALGESTSEGYREPSHFRKYHELHRSHIERQPPTEGSSGKGAIPDRQRFSWED